jgi:hypothetical protein
MALTQTDLDKLELLYAGGATSVRLSDGQEVRYGDDLANRITWLRNKLAAASGRPRSMSSFTTFGRGD